MQGHCIDFFRIVCVGAFAADSRAVLQDHDDPLGTGPDQNDSLFGRLHVSVVQKVRGYRTRIPPHR